MNTFISGADPHCGHTHFADTPGWSYYGSHNSGSRNTRQCIYQIRCRACFGPAASRPPRHYSKPMNLNGARPKQCTVTVQLTGTCKHQYQWLSGVSEHSDKHALGHYPKAQCAFKILMIHEVLQFALRIAFRCVLHRCGIQDIHC